MAIQTRIQFVRGNQATIPSLRDGEPGWCFDTHKLFIGQGGINYEIGGSGSSPLTTKGDIYTFTTINARLPVGNEGDILVVNPSTSTGLQWVAPNDLGIGANSETLSRIWLQM